MAPSRANARAIDSPIPLLLPVTRARLPVRFRSSIVIAPFFRFPIGMRGRAAGTTHSLVPYSPEGDHVLPDQGSAHAAGGACTQGHRRSLEDRDPPLPVRGAEAAVGAEAIGARRQSEGPDPGAARNGAARDRPPRDLQGSAAARGVHGDQARIEPGAGHRVALRMGTPARGRAQRARPARGLRPEAAHRSLSVVNETRTVRTQLACMTWAICQTL